MPSWAKKPSKHFFLGMGGGAIGGLLYHIIDPPGWVVMAIEAVLAVVMVLLLAIPHPPKLLILT
jgi:hypothetical protein